MKKAVLIDRRSAKDLARFPHPVQLKFKAMFEILEEKGTLKEPFGKKLSGSNGLFEIRVKYKGQWRAIYAYIGDNNIIILSAFAKKTQKTPLIELNKANKRLLEYQEVI